MISRLKRQTKRRHSVKADGFRFRYKGADGYWHTLREGTATVELVAPRTFRIIDEPLALDVFATQISVTIDR